MQMGNREYQLFRNTRWKSCEIIKMESWHTVIPPLFILDLEKTVHSGKHQKSPYQERSRTWHRIFTDLHKPDASNHHSEENLK